MRFVLIVCYCGFLMACGPELPDDVAQAMTSGPTEIDFNTHIRPILSDRCYTCHGPDEQTREAELRFDLPPEQQEARLASASIKSVFGNGSSSRSLLVRRILSDDPDEQMPPPSSNLMLEAEEKALLIKWIDQGAEYKDHWAWLPIEHTTSHIDQEHGIIDHYVSGHLDDLGLHPNAEAADITLLRRAYFDLIGLPPTPAQQENFLGDQSPNRWDNLITALMESPHYGEKMASEWLDIARFADTHGYTVDRYRDMSPWRDWVIKAFNDHMPYDDFVIWQLAGDMMPNATKEQILASGFNRNHPQNMEGGIVPEEFRVEYTADRTNTFGTAFLGLTLGCARCHDHKYDPISQREYFQLLSYFDNVDESGQISFDNAMPVPTMILADDRIDSITDMLDQKIAELEAEIEKEALGFIPEEHVSNPSAHLLGYYTFDDESCRNILGDSKRPFSKNSTMQVPIKLADGWKGSAIDLDGDAWIDLDGIAAFERHEPFTISLHVHLPQDLTDGVIFHKGEGAIIYCFRGYHLALRNNGLEVLFARTAPYNAFRLYYAGDVPRNKWTNLTLTYDGSSKARGCQLYIDGFAVDLHVEHDNLYGSILFDREKEPGLQLGARWRGIGIPRARIDELKIYGRSLSAHEVRDLARTDNVQSTTTQSYFASGKGHRQIQRLSALRQQRNRTTDTLSEVMIMQESAERQTHILDRGQYDAPTEPVSSAVPVLLSMGDSDPQNRLQLAKWLFHPRHPLTARVAANRIWQSFFGRGLVNTSEDFGSQGSSPSHPKLLDFLAQELIDRDWDIQYIQRLIMSSETYRRSAKATDRSREVDPENIYFSRGPAKRMTAEMIRDNALAASGLLNPTVGGPSVKPYQPPGLWRVNQSHYEQDQGQNLYRRSLYTIWKRSVPNPTLQTFDMPGRSECIPRRQQTNTPLQSLILLNDPTFVEAARILAMSSKDLDLEDQLTYIYQAVCQRQPSEEELEVLRDLLTQERKRFEQNAGKMEGWLEAGSTGIHPLDAEQSVHLASMSVVASAVLNSDAAIFVR